MKVLPPRNVHRNSAKVYMESEADTSEEGG